MAIYIFSLYKLAQRLKFYQIFIAGKLMSMNVLALFPQTFQYSHQRIESCSNISLVSSLKAPINFLSQVI